MFSKSLQLEGTCCIAGLRSKCRCYETEALPTSICKYLNEKWLLTIIVWNSSREWSDGLSNVFFFFQAQSNPDIHQTAIKTLAVALDSKIATGMISAFWYVSQNLQAMYRCTYNGVLFQAVDYMNYIPKVLEQMSSIWMSWGCVHPHTGFVFLSVCLVTCLCASACVHMRLHVSVCICVCLRASTCICASTCTCICHVRCACLCSRLCLQASVHHLALRLHTVDGEKSYKNHRLNLPSKILWWLLATARKGKLYWTLQHAGLTLAYRQLVHAKFTSVLYYFD